MIIKKRSYVKLIGKTCWKKTNHLGAASEGLGLRWFIEASGSVVIFMACCRRLRNQ
jgi:hypothetical protein